MNTIENKVNQAVRSNEKLSIVSNERLFWTGSIIAAIIASACCWLPLVFVALGVSGIAVSAMFAKFRPIFTILTFGFLVVAFYFTYRPRNKTTKPVIGEECCDDEASAGSDDCCPPRNIAGFSVRRFNKIGLWIVTVVALTFVFFPNYSGFLLAGSNGRSDAVVDRSAKEIVVNIEGMTCGGCEVHVKSELLKVNGVESAQVSHAKKNAIVILNPDKTNNAELINAVEKAGYKVTGIKEALEKQVDAKKGVEQ